MGTLGGVAKLAYGGRPVSDADDDLFSRPAQGVGITSQWGSISPHACVW